jgi:hypothetical protein
VGWSLTAEELHFLAASQDLEFVPGLGPLALDADDPAALRLMLGTAERSVGARDDLDALRPVLDALTDPHWTVSAELAGTEAVAAYGWWPVPGGVAELCQLSATDYGLDVAGAGEFRERVAVFLALEGDDESERPAQADEVPEDATLVRAMRISRAGAGAAGVVLEWADAGEGAVWVVEPEGVTRTGRAAVLKALLGAC